MKYVKIFESRDNWVEKIKELESNYRKIVELNKIDIDYLKDVATHAIDIFSGSEIIYDEIIGFGIPDKGGVDTEWYLGDIDQESNKYDYAEAAKFYKKLYSTDKKTWFEFRIYINYKKDINKKNLFLKEVDEIVGRCKSDGIVFVHNSFDEDDEDDEDDLRSLTMMFFVPIDLSLVKVDIQKALPSKKVKGFNDFVKTYNIPKEGEIDLLKLLSKSKKKKKEKE